MIQSSSFRDYHKKNDMMADSFEGDFPYEVDSRNESE